MAEIVPGVVVAADPEGLTIRVPYRNWQRFARVNNDEVLVELPDGRHMTPEQNGFIWALMTAIGLQAGYGKNEIYQYIYEQAFLPRFRLAIMPTLRREALRLSNATVDEARQFINILIDFCVENDIKTPLPLTAYTEDIGHYVYACLMEKKCCVCGNHADLHHVDPVGMGRDRNEINHIGMRCLPLCRVHHTEAHTMGNEDFMVKYHLQPVKIDEAIAAKYKLGRKKEA